MYIRFSILSLIWTFCAQATLKSDIYALIQKVDPNHNVGIYVADAKTGEAIYAHNADRFYTPASVLKMFTDAMALDVLGPEFTYKTQVWQHGKTNTVILKFSGDPTLKYEDLVQLFKKIDTSKKPVDTFVIDITDPFPLQSPASGWMIEDQDFCFGIPAVPMIINRNSLKFSMSATKPNKKPETTLNPDNFFKIVGAPVVRQKCSVGDSFRRKHIVLQYPNLEIQPKCLEPMAQPMKLCIPVLPTQLQPYIKGMVFEALKQAQVKFSNKIVIVFKPVHSYKNDTLLAEHTSENLMVILKQAMAESDNLVMDSLLLQVLKRIAPDIQEWREIGPVVQRWSKQKLQENLRQAVITEGSGLAHANLLTPKQIGSFLSKIYQDKKFYDLFVQTLTAPQEDGTLQARMKNLKASVKAKTGTLRRHILGLAGYLTTKSGYVLSFSFMANSNFYDDGAEDLRKKHLDLEEAVLERLARL